MDNDNAVFPASWIGKCVATPMQISAAKHYGEKIKLKSDDGEITAYYYNGLTFITEIVVTT